MRVYLGVFHKSGRRSSKLRPGLRVGVHDITARWIDRCLEPLQAKRKDVAIRCSRRFQDDVVVEAGGPGEHPKVNAWSNLGVEDRVPVRGALAGFRPSKAERDLVVGVD